MKKLLITLTMLFTIYYLRAQKISGKELVTDRPDQTESARTIPSGTVQFETGLISEWFGRGVDAERAMGFPDLLVRIGLGEIFELRTSMGLNSLYVKDIDRWKGSVGISDFEAGAKFQLYKKEGSGIEVALLTHVVFPTGTINVADKVWGSISKLAISHDLTESASLGYNLGYDWFSKAGGKFIYSIALGNSINDRWGIYGEIYGSASKRDMPFIINFNGGLTYALKETLQLDFSAGTGLNNKMYYISTGISYRFPLK